MNPLLLPSALRPVFHEQARLSRLSTFQLGGPCAWLADCDNPDTLEQVVHFLRENGVPYILMGGGSNLLFSDEGFDGVMVRYFNDSAVCSIQGDTVRVSGAALLDHAVRAMVEAGLDGLTMCSGIPGTIGGAIVGNAGAFGKQMGDVLEWVELMDAQGNRYRTVANELEFAYRSSRLQASDEVVLSACFRLIPGDRAALATQRESLLALRREKHPDWRTEPCIGSIFKNIEPSSAATRRQAAGWFLEEAGAKALHVGGAYVYPKHANIIVREPHGTAQDVYELSEQMKAAVRAQFGFELQREVRLLGRFEGSLEGSASHYF